MVAFRSQPWHFHTRFERICRDLLATVQTIMFVSFFPSYECGGPAPCGSRHPIDLLACHRARWAPAMRGSGCRTRNRRSRPVKRATMIDWPVLLACSPPGCPASSPPYRDTGGSLRQTAPIFDDYFAATLVSALISVLSVKGIKPLDFARWIARQEKTKTGPILFNVLNSLCLNVLPEIKNPRYSLLGAAGELQPSNYL